MGNCWRAFSREFETNISLFCGASCELSRCGQVFRSETMVNVRANLQMPQVLFEPIQMNSFATSRWIIFSGEAIQIPLDTTIAISLAHFQFEMSMQQCKHCCRSIWIANFHNFSQTEILLGIFFFLFKTRNNAIREFPVSFLQLSIMQLTIRPKLTRSSQRKFPTKLVFNGWIAGTKQPWLFSFEQSNSLIDHQTGIS